MTATVIERRPTRPSMLPPGSSGLEKLIDEQCPDWDGLLAKVQADSTGTCAHPSHKPWLAAEWGLSPFADQFKDLDALFEAGVPWLLERGSPASVRRVLGWLGYTTNVVLEEEGPYLHIDLGRVASAQELEVVARLVRYSIPLHVHFYRVYHGWDLRALRLDGGQPLDQAMLDTDSGAWVDTSTGVLKVSFVSWHRRLLPKQPDGAVDWMHAAWRSDRLPHRAAGTLRWATGGGWGLSTWAPGMDGNAMQLQGTRTPNATPETTPASSWALYSAALAHELPALDQSSCIERSQSLPDRAPQPGWDDGTSWVGTWQSGADSARSETQDSIMAQADPQAMTDTQAQGEAQSTSALPLGTTTTASPVTQQYQGDTTTALRTGDALQAANTQALQSGTANTAAVAPLPTGMAQSTSALPLSTSTVASPVTQQSLGDTSALTPRADALQAASTQALQSSATPTAPMAVTASSAWAQWGSVCASWVRTLGSSDHAHTRQTLWPERFTRLGWANKTWSNTERWGLPLDRRASTLAA